MTHKLTIEYDDAVLLDTGLSAAEFAAEARTLLAAKLYETGRLSSGRAAALCGMDRVAFLDALSRLGIPATNLHADDADSELDFAKS